MSRSGMELKSLLIPKWEAENGRPYDRRQMTYERRLLQRMVKGKVATQEAHELINKSREQLAKKRRWVGEVPRLSAAATSNPTRHHHTTTTTTTASSSASPIANLILEAKAHTSEAAPVA